MSVEKIFEELKASEPSPGKHLEKAQDCLCRVGSDAAYYRRANFLYAASHCFAAIAEIDAEAERGKYLEQARALLVAAHGAGIGKLYVFGYEIRTEPSWPQTRDYQYTTSAEPRMETVESLARVLQERAEKSG